MLLRLGVQANQVLLRVALLRRCWGHLYARCCWPESYCEFATTTLLGALLSAGLGVSMSAATANCDCYGRCCGPTVVCDAATARGAVGAAVRYVATGLGGAALRLALLRALLRALLAGMLLRVLLPRPGLPLRALRAQL